MADDYNMLRLLKTIRVTTEVGLERKNQEDRWGQQDHPDVSWDRWEDPLLDLADVQARLALVRGALAEIIRSGRVGWDLILFEEVLEAFVEGALGASEKLRAELIQVAAVAVAWIEAIDRRTDSE